MAVYTSNTLLYLFSVSLNSAYTTLGTHCWVKSTLKCGNPGILCLSLHFYCTSYALISLYICSKFEQCLCDTWDAVLGEECTEEVYKSWHLVFESTLLVHSLCTSLFEQCLHDTWDTVLGAEYTEEVRKPWQCRICTSCTLPF